MKTTTLKTGNWIEILETIGPDFEMRAPEKDITGEFVYENYQQLKEFGFFSALIPRELGGGGLSHSRMCQVIKKIASYCPSTALAFSMHQHLVAAAVWKYRTNGEGEAMLRKVTNQGLVLISTGARDWLESNGDLTQTEGGYFFNGKKHFASQSATGDVAVTSARYQDSTGEKYVLHFSVPMNTKGVRVLDNWDVMGMRATGSQSIVFDQVFVPETAISLKRDLGEFNQLWMVVLTVAMPLIMSAYVGIAEKAAKIALDKGRNYARNKDHIHYIIGKLNNTLLSAQTEWENMVRIANDFDFHPSKKDVIKILSHKTNVADKCIEVANIAMEALGGQSFFRKVGLERIFRDVHAGPFHPLPKWDQYAFTGKMLLDSQK